MTNTNPIPSLALIVDMYRSGCGSLTEVAYAAIMNKVNWRDMWHLLNSLQVAVGGLDWETHKQRVCDNTKAAQSEARAIIAAQKKAAKSQDKAPAMVDRIMAKYGA